MAPAQKRQSQMKDLWNAEQERVAGLRIKEDALDFTLETRSDSGDAVFKGLRRVAGVDLSFFPDAHHAVAAVVVLSFPNMELVYEQCATLELSVPYIPGYLAFREVPALAAMLRAIDASALPDVVLVDGNGIFHPRQCGAAVHLGVVTGLPAVGVAKEVLLVGALGQRRAAEISRQFNKPGDWAYFGEDSDEPLAALLQPGRGEKPLVVSSGNRISLRTAVELVKAMCPEHVPEPIRQADWRSRRAVAAWLKGEPLPVLALTGPSSKRRRRAKDDAVAKVDGPGSENLQALLTLLPRVPAAEGGAESGAKAAGVASRSRLVWRPKAVAEPAKEDLPGRETNLADVPDLWLRCCDAEPAKRDCCSLAALTDFVQWLLFGAADADDSIRSLEDEHGERPSKVISEVVAAAAHARGS